MKTRAALLRRAGEPFEVVSLDLEEPRAGEVLVELRATGVCHSDWHLRTGDTEHPLPAVVGHEGAGIVRTIGPGVEGVRVGDLVALNWAPNCGNCFYCHEGRPSLCATFVESIWAGTMLDGTTRLSENGRPVYHYSSLACFADLAVVPSVCCVPLPGDLDPAIAALIGCAVTTGVGAALYSAPVRPGSCVVVWGAGGVGLSCIQGALLAGASRIIAIDRFEERLGFARDLGATHTLLAGPDTLDAIRELSEGRGADQVFEAVGQPAVQEECLGAARPGGTIVFVGLSAMGSSTNLPGSLITRQEKTIVGSYYGTAHTARDFPLFAELYRRGRLQLDRLVTRTYDLEQINEAYEDMLAGRVARGLIVFGSP